MKNKKGISPLIATVLLIGFAVALAAVVMTWGGGFIRKTTEETGTTAEKTMMCARLDLRIEGYSCKGNKITLSNNNDIKVEKVVFRFFDINGNFIEEKESLRGIDPYGINEYSPGFPGGSYKVQVIPTLEGDVVCAETPIEKVVNCGGEVD